MADAPWERVKTILADALEREPGQRQAFVADACGSDPELRARVLELLHREQDARQLFESPTASELMKETLEGEVSGRSIGRYELRRVLGTGGMGTVYEAVQDHPHRLVALKVLRRGFVSRSALRRFQHEAEILGRLRHPNIAQVHDAGTFDEGEGAQPYFAMELIRGRPLMEYAEWKTLGSRDRLELVVKVCDAVQHAHLKGVIHRDLKPDNVLVDDYGEPKILDFGVARATDSDIQVTTIRTDVGELIGTVPYMSPEQVAGDPGALDARSDVYSLGVVLYELLTGRLPHDLRDKTIPEAVRIIGEEDPSRLSTVDRSFRGDLDTIVAKALEKEKDRRYQSARDLASDVRHYLGDEPIVARPASTFYQLRKFARRNKALVGGVTGMLLLLAAGTIVSTIGFIQARTESTRVGLVSAFLEEVLASPDPSLRGKHDLTVAELMKDAAPKIEDRFGSHAEIAARVRATIGKTYLNIGWYAEAEEQLRAAYEQSRDHHGADDPRTLEAQLHLLTAVIYMRPRDSVAPSRDLRERMLRVHGRSHPQTVRAVAQLGMALSVQSGGEALAEAETILTEAHELASEVFGADAAETAEISFRLANTLHIQFRPADAEPYAQSCLDWCRRTGADQHLASALTELAYIVGLLGKTGEGYTLTQESLQMISESYGPTSVEIAVALYTAGLNLQWAGRAEEAEEYFERFRGLWDHGHLTLKPTMADFFLARLRLLEGRMTPAEALPFLQAFVDIDFSSWSREFGIPVTGWCLVQLGRYEEAERLMQRCPGRLANAVPDNHFERRLYLNTLAEIYEGLGQPEKVAGYRALLREAEEVDAPESTP
ncbi:MAG: protein kinase domain-containing protein [Planctomycetota bacterium]|jgi:serine/threonine protein kinase